MESSSLKVGSWIAADGRVQTKAPSSHWWPTAFARSDLALSLSTNTSGRRHCCCASCDTKEYVTYEELEPLSAPMLWRAGTYTRLLRALDGLRRFCSRPSLTSSASMRMLFQSYAGWWPPLCSSSIQIERFWRRAWSPFPLTENQKGCWTYSMVKLLCPLKLALRITPCSLMRGQVGLMGCLIVTCWPWKNALPWPEQRC